MSRLDQQQIGSSNNPQTAYLAPQRCLLREVHRENPDTFTLVIEPPSGYETGKPGQFNMLYLFGIGEVPISVSAYDRAANLLRYTVRAVGPVTIALCRMQPGNYLWLRGPFGSHWPEVASQQDLLFVAGGIGLAPLRPALYAALERPRQGRIILMYGARTPEDLLFVDELNEWHQRGQVEVLLSVDQLTVAQRARWRGSVGVVTQLLQQVTLVPARTTVLSCGPDVMMRYVVKGVCGLGVPLEQIYVSLERNMKCAIGFCGRCQWGPHFVCREGPVYRMADITDFWSLREF